MRARLRTMPDRLVPMLSWANIHAANYLMRHAFAVEILIIRDLYSRIVCQRITREFTSLTRQNDRIQKTRWREIKFGRKIARSQID